MEKPLSAAREELLVVFSACGELVDDAVGVHFAMFQAARGEIRVVRSVMEVLRFEAEAGARTDG
jgi:hypothetical protein